MNEEQRREYMREWKRARRAVQASAAAAPRPAHSVGDPIAWMPWAFVAGDYPGAVRQLHGKVIHVNEAHRHYTAEAECNGYRLRESFKF